MNKRGSIVLDAALALPVMLVLILTLISYVRSVQTDMLIRLAMDQTAQEISLLIPACDRLLAGLQLTEDQDLLQELTETTDMGSLLQDAMLDLSSSLLLNRILHSRIDYWLSEASAGQSFRMNQLINRQLYLDWEIHDHQLWLCLTTTMRTPVGDFDRMLRCLVPLWTGYAEKKDDPDTTEAADAIWMQDNFSRGLALRNQYGANLPATFPVIAGFEAGTATSIKSMDLTAPSYENENEVIDRVTSAMEDLVSFQGAEMSSAGTVYRVEAGQIRERQLILIIPQNAPASFHSSCEPLLEATARILNVRLTVMMHGTSHRYDTEEEN